MRGFIGWLRSPLGWLVALIYLFLYVPPIVLIIFSFNSNPLGFEWHRFTLHWYKQLFATSGLWDALGNSLLVAFVSSLLGVSMATAFVLFASPRLLRRLNSFFYLNLAIPEVVLAISLVSFFRISGISLGFPSLIVAHTLLGLGYSVPLIYTRLLGIDSRLVEASCDLGATQWQTLRYVVIPLLRPATFAAAILIFVISLDEFVLSFFCSSGTIITLPMYIFVQIRSGMSPVMGALAATLIMVTSVLVAIFCRVQAWRMRRWE